MFDESNEKQNGSFSNEAWAKIVAHNGTCVPVHGGCNDPRHFSGQRSKMAGQDGKKGNVLRRGTYIRIVKRYYHATWQV